MHTFTPEFENFLGSLIEKKFQEFLIISRPQDQKPKESKREGFLTKKQACEYLSISLSNLNNKLDAKEIPKHYFGSRVLLKPSELDAYLVKRG